jgi:23S rRNA (cytosine1962-C5)-methyltransferase
MAEKQHEQRAASGAAVVVSRKGAARLRGGHVWVFRSDLVGAPEAAPGSIVRVVDQRSNHIGFAFYGPSELALRLLTRADQAPDEGFFRERLQRAIARRTRTFGSARDAMRLVHGESDMLPGLLVDRFGDGLTIQTVCLAMDQREALLIALLGELVGPRVIVARDDGSARDYEGLPRRKELLLGRDPRVTYHEGELTFGVDLLADQKTGGFLDQQDNHLLARRYARGRALDLCCYHGGFGLQLAAGADHVLCVDLSAAAVERVRENAARNGIANFEARCANAFDLLRELDRDGQRFDTIVLDPPSFAKRKSALEGALRGYKELNLRALRMLAPDGVLITCSCSAKLTRDAFEELLRDAAADAHRRVAIVERRGAGADHPVLLGVQETEYLKCFVLQAVE